MPRKPQKKPGPQFDAEPIDDDEQPPFTLDDDGYMVVMKPEPPEEKPSAKGESGRSSKERQVLKARPQRRLDR
jgi:hypothetical protein